MLERQRHVEFDCTAPVERDVAHFEIARNPVSACVVAVATWEEHQAPRVRTRRIDRLGTKEAAFLEREVEFRVEIEPFVALRRLLPRSFMWEIVMS